MSDKKPENPAAFPSMVAIEPSGDVAYPKYEGMTLRDYFANDCPMDFETFLKGISSEQKQQWKTADALLAFSVARFQYADAMLKAREL